MLDPLEFHIGNVEASRALTYLPINSLASIKEIFGSLVTFVSSLNHIEEHISKRT